MIKVFPKILIMILALTLFNCVDKFVAPDNTPTIYYAVPYMEWF